MGLGHGELKMAREGCDCDPCTEALNRKELRGRLPIEPLAKLFPTDGITKNLVRDSYGGYAGSTVKRRFTPTQQREYHRCKKRGYISRNMADQLATALGFHPSELWGDDWYRGDE